ncbi:MAG: DoxX family protein [Planctomycetota bacterium]
MTSPINAVLSIVARVLIAGIFLMSALGNKIPNFSGTAELMASKGIPAPQFMLVGAIAFLVLGGASVVLGYKTRYGASMLLVFLVLATYFFHNFWAIEDPQAMQKEMIQAMKNASLMGTMLLLVVNGPGAGSLDARRRPSGTEGDAAGGDA